MLGQGVSEGDAGTRCLHLEAPVWDEAAATSACPTCGLVMESSQHFVGHSFAEGLGTFIATGEAGPYTGLSGSSLQPHLMHKKRPYGAEMAFLERLATLLSVPAHVVATAKPFLEQAIDRIGGQGGMPHRTLAGIALLAAVRCSQLALSFHELAEHLHLDHHTLGRMYAQAVHALEWRIPAADVDFMVQRACAHIASFSGRPNQELIAKDISRVLAWWQGGAGRANCAGGATAAAAALLVAEARQLTLQPIEAGAAFQVSGKAASQAAAHMRDALVDASTGLPWLKGAITRTTCVQHLWTLLRSKGLADTASADSLRPCRLVESNLPAKERDATSIKPKTCRGKKRRLKSPNGRNDDVVVTEISGSLHCSD